MSDQRLLTGSEFVLVAEIPRGKDRWNQVHFNADLVRDFFRLDPTHRVVRTQQVDSAGQAHEPVDRPLVYSQVNKNYKIEFDVGVREYPSGGRPLLLLLEIGIRTYRYQVLLPGNPGYHEMKALNESLPSVGRGLRRVVTNLDEVELRWPECPLRSPK